MANEWNKTAFVEFETMLKRRLRSGAAPVSACAGFDLDAASAYLEDALGGSHRAGYESHLAGCATCRRHLIELARLAQTAPLAETQPVKALDRIPAWDRWKEAVTVWFDFSPRNLKWRLAGAMGAAFAILIAALGAQAWRHSSKSRELAVVAPKANLVLASNVPSPSPEASPQDQIEATSTAGETIAIQSGRPQVPAPAPLVGLMGKAPEVAITPSNEALRLLSSSPPGEELAAVTPKPSAHETAQNSPQRPSAFFDPRKDSKAEAAKEPVQSSRITPPPGYNPMNPGQPESDLRYQTAQVEPRMLSGTPKSESVAEAQPVDKAPSKLGYLTEPVVEMIRRVSTRSSRKSGFVAESERKTKPDKEATPADESPKPMVVLIRNKVFDFKKGIKKGMLIDHEYKPETDKWRVWTLERGSDQYKKLLANEPMLKEFFDNAPILIVWKDEIYKVLK
ncbi:MAG TPA: zf-HC2 domain-containing protein [Blastocatellia bacterium]|jgi:hypothetical protein|nr:zf-HC2 domain-containing protein [Blastocatellia bacterium]